MLAALMIIGLAAQTAFAIVLIGACLAVASAVVWAICNG